MSVLQGKVPQLSKMFWASSENQMTDEKLFLPSENWKAFWNYQHHYYKIEYKRQYLIKFMTKKKILKPNWKSCLIFA